MDLGFYLGELLTQQGEVSVPGLGYFTLARKSSYYADDEHKFYPPYNQVEFDDQFITDDTLAQYVAQQKNISITSANYFVEKYVTGLKEQALSEKVGIGNLGWFYTENNRLTFQSVDKLADDSNFYGLEPVSISKLTEVPSTEKPQPEAVIEHEPVIEEPIIKEELVIIPPIDEVPAEEVLIEEKEERKRSLWPWILIVSGILIILAGIILGFYFYKPDLFEKFILMPDKPAVVNTVKPVVIDTVKAPDTAITDTAKTDTVKVKKDTVTKSAKTDAKTKVGKPVNTVPAKTVITAAKTILPVVKPAAVTETVVDDAVGTRRFEVIGATARTEATAIKYIANLNAVGLKAWVIPDAPGPLKYVSIAHFKTREEAKVFAKKAIESGKIPRDVYPLEIIPQQ